MVVRARSGVWMKVLMRAVTSVWKPAWRTIESTPKAPRVSSIGIRTLKDFSTAGGTPSGILMRSLSTPETLMKSVGANRPMMMAVNMPLVPV